MCTPTRDWNHNLDMCPDWESNPQPFSLPGDTPTHWATLARAKLSFWNVTLPSTRQEVASISFPLILNCPWDWLWQIEVALWFSRLNLKGSAAFSFTFEMRLLGTQPPRCEKARAAMWKRPCGRKRAPWPTALMGGNSGSSMPSRASTYTMCSRITIYSGPLPIFKLDYYYYYYYYYYFAIELYTFFLHFGY